jgi:hypothetical protein
MGIRHIKLEQRLSEEIIEANYGQQRYDVRFKKTPAQCDSGCYKEVERGRRREIEMKSVGNPGDKQCRCDPSRDPYSDIASCSFGHSLTAMKANSNLGSIKNS